ncbi:MAG: hypothetical protein LAP21_08980 [Acidobacteriia bacterium]|nr:hypothetical protein [Terriglobia bacterium]
MICLLLCVTPGIAQNSNTSSPAQDCGKDACKATENANVAATNANTAATSVNTAAGTANAAASNADTAAGLARDAAGKANQAAVDANGKVVEVQGAAQRAMDASDVALKAAKNTNSETALQRLMQRKGVSAKRPLDDYVPCLFDGPEDFDLRARGNPYDKTRKPEDPLTELEAAQIVTSVMDSINVGARNNPQSWQLTLGTALSDFDPNELVGMRPALAAQYLTKKLTERLPKPDAANTDKMAGFVAMAQQKKTVADTVF